MTTQVFRVFISSTFSDMAQERDALQRHVYPRLRELCDQYGARFQAVDLRWGVSDEAGFDNQTMVICLSEIERCQQVTSGINFVILLGERYGWQPLPHTIPIEEWEQICRSLEGNREALEMLGRWYRCDKNAVSPVYILQARNGPYLDYTAWSEQEAFLRFVLRQAVGALPFTSEQRLKYTGSATEQEIDAGVFRAENPEESAFCYFRTIENLPDDAGAYRDLNPDGSIDDYAAQQILSLRERLLARLPSNVRHFQAIWNGGKPTNDHIDQFCEAVYLDLAGKIEKQLETEQKDDTYERENAAHTEFATRRGADFQGRDADLGKVYEYLTFDRHPAFRLTAPAQQSPLVLLGEAGIGKSALMAQAFQQLKIQFPAAVICGRFLGVTPASANIHSLIDSLCHEIYRAYGGDESGIPVDFKTLVQAFLSLLEYIPDEKPLIIFLDALDQLSETNNAQNLLWLPVQLPRNVRLVVSMLPSYDQLLKEKLPADNCIELDGLSLADGERILHTWMQKVKRTLQPTQRREVLDKFSTHGNPLHLRLAFEEARLWRSYDAPITLGADSRQLIKNNLFRRLTDESNHGQLLVERSLGYLASARNGLTEDEMIDVLSEDHVFFDEFLRRAHHQVIGNHLPPVVWSRLYFDLAPYLSERQADGASVLSFYHRELRIAAESEYLDPTSRRLRHQVLASYFGEMPFVSEKTGICNQRKLSELPYHQFFSGYFSNLRETLTNFTFVESKIAATSVDSLCEDYDRVRDMPGFASDRGWIDSLTEALRLSEYVLANDSEQVAGQLTGRLSHLNNLPEIASLLKQMRQSQRPWLSPQSASLTAPGGALLHTLLGHSQPVTSVVFDPRGQIIFSASADQTIKAWDFSSGLELYTLREHELGVYTLAISPSGSFLLSADRLVDATSGGSKTVVWQVSTRSLKTSIDSKRPVIRGGFLEDEHIIWLFTGNGTLFVTNWVLDEPLITINNNEWSSAAEVTNDVKYVYCAVKHGSELRLWSIIDNKLQRTWNMPEYPGRKFGQQGNTISSLVLLSDDRTVLALCGNGSLYLFHPDSETPLKTLKPPFAQTSIKWSALALTEKEDRAITAAEQIIVRDPEEKEQPRWLKGHTADINSVAVSRSAKYMASGANDNTIKVWDLDRSFSTPAFILNQHSAAVFYLLLMRDHKHLVSCGGDGSIYLWDIQSAERIHIFSEETNTSPTSAIFNFDETLLAVAYNNGDVHIWDVKERVSKGKIPPRNTTYRYDNHFARFVPGTGKLLLTEPDIKMTLWELSTSDKWLQVATIPITKSSKSDVGGFLSLDLQGEYMFSRFEGLQRRKLDDLPNYDTASYTAPLAFTPDGRWAVSQDTTDGCICLWSIDTLKSTLRLKPNAGDLLCAACSLDGTWFAAGMGNRSIIIFDLKTGERRNLLQGHTNTINCLIALKDGTHLVSCSGSALIAQDYSVRVWNVMTGQPVATFTAEAPINACVYESELNCIIAGDQSGRVHFLRLMGF
jgi:NACHT domain- and WD repeat-containing protein